MKISELTTSNALDVLCEITPYISNITADDSVMGTIGKAVVKDGMTRAGIILEATERINKIVPILLKTHRTDLYGIISAVNQSSIEEIGNQNLMVTMSQIKEICTDKELIGFFESCVRQGKNG